MTEQKICPKCGGMMEEGFVPDFSRAQEAMNQNCWLPGKVERDFLEHIKFNWEKLKPIVHYRCTRCGYLESYAPAREG